MKRIGRRKELTMRESWEDTLFRMADKERMVMPKTMSDKIEETLGKLNDDQYKDQCKSGGNGQEAGRGKAFRMNWKRSLILAAVLTVLASATAAASAGAVRERMEAMNREKIETYFAQIYQTKIGHDNYNRPYEEEEKNRMDTLREAYEEEAHFPKGEITMLDAVQDYKGRGVAFFGDTSTFFFPDREMSDEELLEIIDFMHRRDYSLQKMNEMIEAGEAQLPKMEEPVLEATEEEILLTDAVYEPEQELTIPYTGDLELDLTVAAGQRELFLAGWNTVHKMEIGSSDSRLFFDGFDAQTRILAMCQDTNGDVYMAVWQWPAKDQEKRDLSVWVADRNGELLRKINMDPFLAPERQGYVSRMVIDKNGYLYLKTAGLATFKDAAECEILVLDREGSYVNSISGGEYCLDLLGGLGIGKDGKVYTQIGNYYDPDHPGTHMGIASVDAEKGTLAEIYFDIVPEGTIMLDIVAPGARTDFVFWGYDGIFTYNLGDESAVNVLPAYEAPCDFEGARSCALPDGRIVLAECSDYRTEETEYGRRRYAVPEKTCFYYLPGM